MNTQSLKNNLMNVSYYYVTCVIFTQDFIVGLLPPHFFFPLKRQIVSWGRFIIIHVIHSAVIHTDCPGIFIKNAINETVVPVLQYF